jgi:FkbH-like protein
MSNKDRIIDLLQRLPPATKQQIIARLHRRPLAQPTAGTMEAQFKSSLAAILKLDAEQIDLARCALDYGMDSISFMQWLNLWQKRHSADLRGIEVQLHEPLSSWLDSIVALPPSAYSAPQADDQWHDMLWNAQGSASASDEPAMQLLSRLLAERVALRVHGGQLHLRYAQALPDSVAQLLAGNEQRLLAELGQGEWYPAFPIQRRYWLMTEMSGERALYTNIIGLALHGKLNQDLLRDLCLQLLQSEKALRVVLHRVGQQIVQQVCVPEQAFDFQTIDLQQEEDAQQARQRLRQILREDAAVDKQQGPCVKFRLFHLAPQVSHFYLLIDHIVSDAFSLIQLMHILLDSLQHGRLQLPASWRSRSYLDKALLPPPAIAESTRQFWRDYLQDAPYNTNLPLTATAAERDLPQYSGATARIDLAGLPQLSAFAAEHKITLFKLVSALLLRLLQDWSGETELVVGFPVQRKTDPADLEMIGDYTNTLPLRVRLPQRGEWSRLLTELSANLDQLMQHADLPFEQIASLQPRRMEFENPLFNVMFNEQPSYAGLNRQADQLQANLLDDPNLTACAKMALMFIWSQNGDRLSLFCEYRSKLFSAANIEQLLAGLPSLIDQCLHHAQPPRLCIAASFSIEPMEKELREWFAFFDWEQDIACADFNQVFQELVNPHSLLANNRDGVNLILVRAEDVAANSDEWLQLLQNFLQVHRSPLILMLCADSEAWQAKHGDMDDWCALLKEGLAAFAHATVIDSAHIAQSYPVAVRDDPHRYRLGQIPYTDPYYRALAASATRAMFALRYKKPKVIVLDCDNTLWQGVIGEDGMDGIRLSPALLQLQQRMIELQQAGILLCLCSKNVEADVMQVLQQHPVMLLRPEHLVGWKINWQAKSENIAQLAHELSLGEDSFVFIDDNPVEISEVRAACPAVTCLLLPREDSAIARFVAHHWLLDVPNQSTGEDVNRTRMYQQNRQRSQLLQSTGGFLEFLDKLQLDIRIEPMTEAQLERVAQLMTRTNQFNTTTRRRSAAEIQAYQAATGQVHTVTVKDRFGDYGLVGVLLYRLYDDICEVDDLLMSCRVLGRGVEHRIIAYAAQQGLQHGKSRLVIAYRQTAKNQPVRLLIEQELLPEQKLAEEDGCERLLFSAARLADLRYAPPQTPVAEYSSAPRAHRSEYNTALLARLQTLQQAGAEFYPQALLPARTHTLLQQRLDQWLHKVAL